MSDVPTNFSALLSTQADDETELAVVSMALADLPSDGALIEVHASSVNYKDGLATTPKGRVAQISPLVPGIDLAGVVVDGAGDGFEVGDKVVAHGYDTGVARHGGFAEYACVPTGWLVRQPDTLTATEAMTIGTAGFTAALSVVQLEEHGLTPDAGPVVVTGATGGVGSTAVNILAKRGYDVIASTGKADAEVYLRSIGASSIIDRSGLSEPGKPLQRPVWAAGVDCVGGNTLANVIACTEYGGAVAASGLTGGADLPATVMPFILRGVALLGVDSVQTPIERRRDVWARLGDDLRPEGLDQIATEVGLADLPSVLASILAGGVTGRNVVTFGR